MTPTQLCPQCHNQLPGGRWSDLCPRCLTRVSLATFRRRRISETSKTSLLFPPAGTAVPTFLTGPPSRIGEYELLEEIARGGTAIVWRARQSKLGRIVALKLMREAQFAGLEAGQRFRSEAASVAALQHPHIVALHDYGEQDGQPWISMALIEGTTLAHLVRKQPVPPRDAATLLRTIAEAIAYAHSRGILHRDLKPSNILLDQNGQPYVTDFGLAKRFFNPESGTANSAVTLSGQFLGTPNYAPPEQLALHRDRVGPQSDVYALGAMLYEMVTGRPPFLAATLEATLLQVIDTEPAAPTLLNPVVPVDLETICLKCLEKEPSCRYPTVQDVVDELRRFLGDEPIHARPIGTVGRLGRWCRRRPALATALAALTIIFLVGFSAAAWQWRRAERAGATTAGALIRMEIEKAESLFESNDTEAALAHLGKVLRKDPDNRVAAERALSAMTYRSFPLPIGAALQHDGVVHSARFSPDARRVITASADHSARIWDAKTGRARSASLQHRGPVYSAEFDPTGTRALTASDDGTAAIWDSSTGKLLAPLLTHSGPVKFAQFSPDGARIATASADYTARIWDAFDGKPLSPLLVHSNAVKTARFSSNGQLLITASADGTARIWDAIDGRPVLRIKDSELVDAEFSPDSTRVLTVAMRGTARIWNVRGGELLTEIPPQPFWINAGRFSPDGQLVIASYNNCLARIWDANTGKLFAGPLPHDGAVFAGSFSAVDDRVITASEDGTAGIWNAQTGELLLHRLRHPRAVLSAEISPNGRLALTSSADSTAMLWEIAEGRALPRVMRHPAGVIRTHWSPEGQRILTLCRDNIPRVWNVTHSEVQTQMGRHTRELMNGSFSPEGRRVITASRDQTALIWDAETGGILTKPLQHDRVVWGSVFSHDGRLAATASWDEKVRIWNADTGLLNRAPLQFGLAVTCVSFSPGDDLLAMGGMKGAKIYNLITGTEATRLLAHKGDVFHVEFSPDGKRLLTASTDGSARVWDVRTCEPVTEPLRHASAVGYARYSPDGLLVVTCSFDRTARIWDAGTGRPVTAPLRHKDQVFWASFSPDSSRLGTASYDHTARIWDVRTGQPLSEPFIHDEKVFSANFSPDGQYLATCSDDGATCVWDTPSVPTPVPAWFTDFIEALAGRQLEENGNSRIIPASRLFAIKERILKQDAADFYARWGQWFFADRSARSRSPLSHVATSAR